MDTLDMPYGMLIKKMYCHKCGTQLTEQLLYNEYHQKRLEWGFSFLSFYIRLRPKTGREYYYIYKCPKCGNKISYSNQCKIEKVQKSLNKKILDEADLDRFMIIM